MAMAMAIANVGDRMRRMRGGSPVLLALGCFRRSFFVIFFFRRLDDASSYFHRFSRRRFF